MLSISAYSGVPSTSLAHARIFPKVRPGKGTPAVPRSWHSPSIPSAPTSAADFTLRYVDQGGHRDFGGWTLIPAIFTLTLFPVVEDLDVAAELQLRDRNDLLFARYPLRLGLIKVYGIDALYYMGIDFIASDRISGRKSRNAASLRRYVTDLLYTYSQRLAASAAKPARAIP